MAQAPRRLGRPLDLEAAQSRTLQIATLSDAVRLQILSVIATAAESERTLDALVVAVGIPREDIAGHLDVLANAGLVIVDDDNEYQLTADSWVRFGRLLSDATALNQAPRAVSLPSVELPPVAARIATDLAYRFSAYFSPETVAKYVGESYSLLSERANIRSFLPSLTTRFATDRLSALATAQGLVLRGTPEVLFVCVQNAGRSQMAAAMLRQLAGDRVHVRTAGSAPAASVHQSVIDALDEIGVPLASEFPKPLTDEVVQAADFVITMGCGDACPIYPGRRYMDWPIDDPVGLPMSEVRRVRDDILARVHGLLDEMN